MHKKANRESKTSGNSCCQMLAMIRASFKLGKSQMASLRNSIQARADELSRSFDWCVQQLFDALKSISKKPENRKSLLEGKYLPTTA